MGFRECLADFVSSEECAGIPFVKLYSDFIALTQHIFFMHSIEQVVLGTFYIDL